MSQFIARARVVLASAVTWIVLAVAVVQYVAAEAAKVLPADQAELVGTWAARAVSVLLGVVAIIRRVTPVVESQRGVLPPPSGLVDRAGVPVPRDPGQVTVGLVLLVVVVVLAVLFVVTQLGWV